MAKLKILSREDAGKRICYRYSLALRVTIFACCFFNEAITDVSDNE